MIEIDQSLDDIIKKQREQKKKMKGTANQSKDSKIPKKTTGGVKSRAAIRTQWAIRSSKPNSPYAAPTKVKKETALFTASYKASEAPIKEIFTAGYIPKPATNLKLFTINKTVGLTTRKRQQQQQASAGPLTTKPMRLVTTQQIKREGLTSSSAAAATAKRQDERIPTGPRIPETSAHLRRDSHRSASGSAPINRQGDRNSQYQDDNRGGNKHQETRSGNSTHANSKNIGNRTSHSNNNASRQGASHRATEQSRRQDNRSSGRNSTVNSSSSMSMDVDMEVDSSSIAFKGSAPEQQSVAFRGESGPVTIEIENLDPGTTADDVKYVCSRFGEIRSCICTNGFAQVTYVRKAAGQAAIDNLHGKKADNNQILRVTMRPEAIIHDESPSIANRVPSSIAGPMKILQKAVHGTLRNAGTLYSDNILAAERVLREQQQRMAQLQDEEQRMAMLRMQNSQLNEDSPAARQRMRTEPSPRHQHNSSGWLGPYNEQSSPIPSLKSPRGARFPVGHHSPAVPERNISQGGTTTGVIGSDRIGDTYHRTLGGWQQDGAVGRNNNNVFSPAARVEEGSPVFKRREFEPRNSYSNIADQGGFPSSQMEPSNSIQSLVESIDDDHVLKLTEMTKKRVEHNNPTVQKRQRVVSLPTNDPSTVPQYIPSEKSLQLSNHCKSVLEAKYSELFRSIKEGHPPNPLLKLREVLPRVKTMSMPRSGTDGRTSMDVGHSRSRRSKHDKYRFVNKVEESNCIWDVDLMESKARQADMAEAAALSRMPTLGSQGSHSQQYLNRTMNGLSQDSLQQHLSSTSMESFGVEHSTSGDSYGPPIMSNIQEQDETPQEQLNQESSGEMTRENTNYPSEPSPLCAVPSAKNPEYTRGSSYSSIENIPLSQAKDTLEVSTPHFIDSTVTEHPALSNTSMQGSTLTDVYSGYGSTQEQSHVEMPTSKRNSFLGMFYLRGKKNGHEADHHHHHQELQPPSTYGGPSPNGITPIHERRSLDSQHNPSIPPFHIPSQGQRYAPTVEVIPPSLIGSPSDNASQSRSYSKRRPSLDQTATRLADPNDPNIMLTDDEVGGQWAPPAQWAEGERLDDSQDESDNVPNTTQKRSSLRRFTDKMIWKRGHKTLSAIQQGETPINSPTSPAHGKSFFSEGNKSVGKKLDPSLAHLQGQSSSRLSSSQPSSGRNSLDGVQRPKLNNFWVSSTSSPVLDAVKTPDGVNSGSPRIGPLPSVQDFANRLDKATMSSLIRNEKSPTPNPATRTDKSPMLNPVHNDKSPLLAPASGLSGDDAVGPLITEPTPTTPQLLVECDRLPKRLMERLKQRPELASVDWTAETVDLSPLLASQEPMPTYDEYLGITSEMKKYHLYPSHLNNIDVLDIRLILEPEEHRDVDAKNRARKWDMLEMRLDQEYDHNEKWIKEVVAWSKKKYDSIDRHRRAEHPEAYWPIAGDGPLFEEPDEDVATEEDASQAFLRVSDAAKRRGSPPTPTPHIASLETLKARKQQRDLSLSSTRERGGSMSSIHASVTATFKASLESTQESVREMRVMMADCRQRLIQLNEATGTQLREKEPLFKEVVDKFTAEWNESYFVKLKEVEDQIQVMNQKRIENPWMDMLLIMLSWVIRGLFYIVEGVTIMIIIVRHVWGKAKQGYETIRGARQGYVATSDSDLLGLLGADSLTPDERAKLKA
ncbi:hypothetical protein FBU30_002580 [Linnemannia zychae]|nr:hypothetical protein FBU30_002580 [Linnemannia zychae]